MSYRRRMEWNALAGLLLRVVAFHAAPALSQHTNEGTGSSNMPAGRLEMILGIVGGSVCLILCFVMIRLRGRWRSQLMEESDHLVTLKSAAIPINEDKTSDEDVVELALQDVGGSDGSLGSTTGSMDHTIPTLPTSLLTNKPSPNLGGSSSSLNESRKRFKLSGTQSESPPEKRNQNRRATTSDIKPVIPRLALHKVNNNNPENGNNTPRLLLHSPPSDGPLTPNRQSLLLTPRTHPFPSGSISPPHRHRSASLSLMGHSSPIVACHLSGKAKTPVLPNPLPKQL